MSSNHRISQYHFLSWSLSLVSYSLDHSSLCGVSDGRELTLETLNKERLQYFICKKRLIRGLVILKIGFRRPRQQYEKRSCCL